MTQRAFVTWTYFQKEGLASSRTAEWAALILGPAAAEGGLIRDAVCRVPTAGVRKQVWFVGRVVNSSRAATAEFACHCQL